MELFFYYYNGFSGCVSLVGGKIACSVVDGIDSDSPVDGENATGVELSFCSRDVGIPFKRYSIALSGLLKLAFNAAITYRLLINQMLN